MNMDFSRFPVCINTAHRLIFITCLSPFPGKMSTSDFPPLRPHYDIVIVGGATSGSSTAWNLSTNPDFKGPVLVEWEPSLQHSATKAIRNCMRQQFATAINVQIAKYAANFVKHFGAGFPPDECVPDSPINNFGRLYLSDSSTSRDAEDGSETAGQLRSRHADVTNDRYQGKISILLHR